jgi:hypothetical protein
MTRCVQQPKATEQPSNRDNIMMTGNLACTSLPIAVAALIALAPSAWAQSSVTVFGVADLAARSVSNEGTCKREDVLRFIEKPPRVTSREWQLSGSQFANRSVRTEVGCDAERALSGNTAERLLMAGSVNSGP